MGYGHFSLLKCPWVVDTLNSARYVPQRAGAKIFFAMSTSQGHFRECRPPYSFSLLALIWPGGFICFWWADYVRPMRTRQKGGRVNPSRPVFHRCKGGASAPGVPCVLCIAHTRETQRTHTPDTRPRLPASRLLRHQLRIIPYCHPLKSARYALTLPSAGR